MHFQVLSIILLLIFYGCYFIKMISQRRKGVQTDQMGKGKSGFVKLVEVTLKIVTCLVPAVEVISVILNTSAFPVAMRWIGFAFAFFGDGIFVCSVLTMQDNWRAGVSESEQTHLVTNGIYQISRNPAFLGFDLVYIGIFLMFFNWAIFAVSLFTMVMFHLQIVNVEEDHLLKAFGEEYLTYRKKVNRYLGRKIKK